MSQIIRAILVGGKRDYARAYEKLQRQLLETFDISAEWDPRGDATITAEDYDLVLLSSDISGHIIIDGAMKDARDAGLPIQHIVRKWSETFMRLKGAGYPVVSPELRGEPAEVLPRLHEPMLPGEVEALIDQLRAACAVHRVTSLVFDLSAGEVEFEQEIVRTVRGTYTLQEAA